MAEQESQELPMDFAAMEKFTPAQERGRIVALVRERARIWTEYGGRKDLGDVLRSTADAIEAGEYEAGQ